ncbi:MAG: regulatory protein RecX [Candidatus Gracilibacteria bacterium]|jgi:SOS response regulatory protein OraA/RecX
MEAQKYLLQRALYFLARRPHSTTEIRQKLSRIKVWAAKTTGGNAKIPDNTEKAGSTAKIPANPEDITKIIQRLTELGYLNDEDFARIYIGSSLRRKPQGLRLLEMNLRQKGIDESTFATALKLASVENQFDESDLAQDAADKKLRTLSKLPPNKQKEKLYRFLASRGFSMDSIMKVLNKFSS